MDEMTKPTLRLLLLQCFLVWAARAANAAEPHSYLAAFDELVRSIEREHVFAPSYARVVGHAWSEDVARLRAEMARARDRSDALVALRHLENSLHDRHCRLEPPRGVPVMVLQLGVILWAGGRADAPDMRVDALLDPTLRGAVSPGDRLLAVDGTPVAAWLAAHPFETNALEPRAQLADAARAITTARLPWSTVKEGDKRTLTVEHGGAPRDLSLPYQAEWRTAGDNLDVDRLPPMAKVDCNPKSPPAYGPGYALTAVGLNVCVYQPVAAAPPRIPIVRYLSFSYVPTPVDEVTAWRAYRADHDLLVRELRDADSVVLDLHENKGGNAPYLFLGWFSQAPFDHLRVVTRVLPGPDGEALARAIFRPEEQATYRAAQAANRPSLTTGFFCGLEWRCACEHDTSDPAERVTRAPVAVLTGPFCMSSCDTFSSTWSQFRLGPIVGKQPAHAFTVYRHVLPVAGQRGEDLGRFTVAVSHSEYREGASIEGEPLRLDWEAGDDFDHRASWVTDAVAEARRRLVQKSAASASRPN
jgi:hypothetical protein